MNSLAPVNHKARHVARIADYVRRSKRDHMELPGHLQPDLDYVLASEAAVAFQPRNLLEHACADRAIKLLEQTMPNLDARRRYELKMADYLQHRIFPVYGKITTGRDKVLLSERMRHCRDHGVVCMDQMGDIKHRWPIKCGQAKLCAHEAREEAQRLSSRYLGPMVNYLKHGGELHPKAKLQYWVISPLNCRPGQLHDYKRTLMKVYSKLNRRKLTEHVVGSVVVQEDPVGRQGDWNVHLNVLALVDGHFSWADYQQAWKDELGHDHVSIEFLSEDDMRRRSMRKAEHRRDKYGVANMPTSRYQVLSDAFVELIKYTTKITGHDHHQDGLIDQQDFDFGSEKYERAFTLKRAEAPPMYAWKPQMWWEWYCANKGFRRTRSYGALFRVCDTCGMYGHTAEDCACIVMADPDPIPLTDITWSDQDARYKADIDLIPAHNSTKDYIYTPSFDRENRGPP